MTSTRGRPLLLLKGDSSPSLEEDPYAQLAAREGYDAIVCPTLCFVYYDRAIEYLQSVLTDPPSTQCIIATSPRAIGAILKATETTKAHPSWLELPVFVSGSRTGTEARRIGFRKVVEPMHERGRGAAEVVVESVAAYTIKIQRAYFICGQKRRDVVTRQLESTGCAVHEVIAYTSTPRHNMTPELLDFAGRIPRADVAGIGVSSCWLAFFSPSGVDAYISALQVFQAQYPDQYQILQRAKIAAIGITTEAALLKLGWTKVHAVSPKPQPDSFFRELKHQDSTQHSKDCR